MNHRSLINRVTTAVLGVASLGSVMAATPAVMAADVQFTAEKTRSCALALVKHEVKLTNTFPTTVQPYYNGHNRLSGIEIDAPGARLGRYPGSLVFDEPGEHDITVTAHAGAYMLHNYIRCWPTEL